MKNIIRSFQSEKLQILFLVLSAAAGRFYFLLKFENMPGNATEYIVRALNIVDNPDLFLNFEGNCSTFFTYVLAALLTFWKDPIIAPRTFTMIFGVLLMLPYYGTLRGLFGRKIAFFSTFTLAICPLHIVQSSAATPDAAYYFFLFGSLFYFFGQNESSEKSSELLFSAFLFNIASLLRFESWAFIPLLFFFQWVKNKKKALWLIMLLAVSPCIWFLLNDIVYQDFAFSFRTAALTAHIEITSSKVPYDPRIISWLVVLWRSAGPSVVVGGLLGIAFAFLKRTGRRLSLFFLTLFSIFTLNTCSAKMWHNERYIIVLVLFLIPYAWFFIDRSAYFLREKRRAALLLFCCFLFLSDSLRIIQKPFETIPHILNFLPPEVKAVALWLKANVQKNETLIMGADPADVHDSYILIRGNILPPKRCLVIRATDPYFREGEPFQDFMRTARPTYLVINSKSALQNKINFNLNEQMQIYQGALFYKVYEQEVTGYRMKYSIYKITHK